MEDVLSDLDMMTDLPRDHYISPDLGVEIQNWISLIQLSIILGDILTLCYQQLGTKPTLAQFDALEDKLSGLKIPSLSDSNQSSLATFSNYHLQLHLQATLITFYRPFVSVAPQGLPSASEKSWKARMRSHMETAATQVNTILDSIAREGLVGFASPMTPPLLVPAMHVHLLGCKSDDRLTRRLAFNKLEMCMTIMRELQKTHTSASIFCGVFGEAVRQLVPGHLDETVWGTAQVRGSFTTSPASGVGTVDFNDPGVQPVVTDDILESLLNETSTYNFWESMNLPEQSVMEYGRY
ncbi:hypothetical protein G6514_001361 [Epicoccum nigrum]|nr:hypothetical protein G6514_001361 [Epicoccum nigrum]